MIGLLIDNKAITKDTVLVDPENLPKDVYWISPFVEAKNIGQVVSWGSLNDIFGLHSSISIKDAQRISGDITELMPSEWCVPGKTIRQQLYSLIPAKYKLITPIPESVEQNILDQVRINPAKALGSKKIEPNQNINLSDLTLPEKITHTKMVYNPSQDHEGYYEVKIENNPLNPFEPLNGEIWVTRKQLETLQKYKFRVQVIRAVKFVSQNGFAPASEHPMLEPLVEPLKNYKPSDREKLEKVIVEFLINIPRTQGIHPASMLIQGQLWANSLKEVMSLKNNGIYLTRFSHSSIWVNINE